MKKIALVLVALAVILGCSKNETSLDQSLRGLATFDGLSEALKGDTDVVVFDVRTAEEYKAGHIPGAENISHEVIADAIPVEDKDAIIVLYCTSGNRSGKAFRALKALGYKNIVDFGGIPKWKSGLVTGDSPG